ncbi:protein of unknown function [Methylocella tundrae]|uniref:Uncharacterized protein n=1 Tax=Methylocella tundrae TaxID=227605 RepID=A0A4U8YYR2_METTU|nr:protein of unknown function [Methylocella tundrae]
MRLAPQGGFVKTCVRGFIVPFVALDISVSSLREGHDEELRLKEVLGARPLKVYVNIQCAPPHRTLFGARLAWF